MSWPSNRIAPAVGSSSRSSVAAQGASCRSPTRRPGRASPPRHRRSDTPSTARTERDLRCPSSPPRTGKWLQVRDLEQSRHYAASSSGEAGHGIVASHLRARRATVRERRIDLGAARPGPVAAVAEAAARREVREAGDHAGDGLQLRRPARCGERARDRAEQARGVGVARAGEELRRRAPLHDPAGVHHHHLRRSVSATTPRSWVMSSTAMPALRLQARGAARGSGPGW